MRGLQQLEQVRGGCTQSRKKAAKMKQKEEKKIILRFEIVLGSG